MGLLDDAYQSIKGGLLNQWQQGEPYRAALGGLLAGDTAPMRGLMGGSVNDLAASSKPTAKMAGIGYDPTAQRRVTDQMANIAMTFAGPMANTADLAKLEQAKQLAANGADNRQVWANTGWFQGPDKQWRFEIDDSGAKWLRNLPFEKRVEPMNNVISHDELYGAYPELGKLTTVFGQNVNAEGGIGSYHFDPLVKRGVVNIESGGSNAIQNAKSTGLHELQHAIQRDERFATGGNVEDEIHFLLNNDSELKRLVTQAGMSKDAAIMFLGGAQKYRDAGYENYKRLAGEAEARAVEARMNMTPAERAQLFPLDSYDVPLDQLIVRYK